MQLTQGLRRAMQIEGNRIATICGDRQQTYKEFGTRVAKLAGALKGLGLGIDDRVTVISHNSDRFMECLYGIPWAGGIFVPINFRLGDEELAHILKDSAPRVVVVEYPFLELYRRISKDIDGIKHVIVVDGENLSDDLIDYNQLVEAADPIEDAGRRGNDLLTFFYTGGTTGLPKGVMLSHNNICHFALGFLVDEKMNEQIVHMHVAPMFHMSCIGVLFTTMVAGTHVILPRFEPLLSLETIQKHGVTHCLSVPVMVERMLFHPRAKEFDLSTLRMLGYGGSPMPQEILRRAKAEYPKLEFAQGYGMTEAPGAGFLGARHHDEESQANGRIKSAGRSITTCEIIVADENDKELPRGEVGEILIRGPVVMRGYWNNPELTAETLRNGWMHTGDGGYMDEDGFVYVTDRIKDMIISGGENVYSTEVENILYQHPAIGRCAVIGIPSDQWGEEVIAVVELNEGKTASEDEIIAHSRERLAHYKCPRQIIISAEPLPLSAAGKVLKAKLREPFWRDKGRRI